MNTAREAAWSEWHRNPDRLESDQPMELAAFNIGWDAAAAHERERIARAIQAACPVHVTRDYTPVDAAYDHAARIARTQAEPEGTGHE